MGIEGLEGEIEEEEEEVVGDLKVLWRWVEPLLVLGLGLVLALRDLEVEVKVGFDRVWFAVTRA